MSGTETSHVPFSPVPSEILLWPYLAVAVHLVQLQLQRSKPKNLGWWLDQPPLKKYACQNGWKSSPIFATQKMLKAHFISETHFCGNLFGGFWRNPWCGFLIELAFGSDFLWFFSVSKAEDFLIWVLKIKGRHKLSWFVFCSNSRSLCGFLAPVSHVIKTLDVLIHVSVAWAMGLCSVHSGQRPQESATLKVTRSPSWRFHPRCLVKFLKDRSPGDMNSMKIQQVQRWFVGLVSTLYPFFFGCGKG